MGRDSGVGTVPSLFQMGNPGIHKLSGRRMRRRIFITAIIIAVIHLAVAIGSILIAFSSGMEAFDNPDHQPSMFEHVAGSLAGILMQPGMSLWTPWMSKNMPDIFEWGLCLFNSLLWGIVLATILNARALVRGKNLDNIGRGNSG